MNKIFLYLKNRIKYLASFSLLVLLSLSTVTFAAAVKFQNAEFSITLPKNARVQCKQLAVPGGSSSKISSPTCFIKVTNDIDLMMIIMSQSSVTSPITIADQRNAITGMVDGFKKQSGKQVSKDESDGVYQSIQSTHINGKDYQIFKLPVSKGKWIFYTYVSNKKLCLMAFSLPYSKINSSDSVINPILDSLILK